MRLIPAAGLGLVALSLMATPVRAQEFNDSFHWYLGAEGGMFGFRTPTQTRTWVPSVGAGLLVVAKRTGLLISVDEALGSSETTGYTDVTLESQVRPVSFDRIRRYAATFTGYPMKSSTRPYFGVGFSMIQVVGPKVGGSFSSEVSAAQGAALASRKSATGHLTFSAGFEFHLGRALGFGQYQIASAPDRSSLLRGAAHGVTGGFRFLLGGAREGIKGGGY